VSSNWETYSEAVTFGARPLTQNILSLKGIYKSFLVSKTKEAFKALENINIYVKAGEWVGIVGESGSGKSTIARIIMQIEAQDEGSILFLGEELSNLGTAKKRDFYRNIQMVFQSPSSTFSERMKIGIYLMEPFLNYKIKNRKAAELEAKQLLVKVNLPVSYFNRYPHELSGGELQRVVIARAIGLKPSLIIFDEATSALDVATQREIINLLSALKDEIQFSAIFISHNIALVKQITERTYVVYQGKIVDEFKSENLLKEERNSYTKLLVRSVFGMEY